MKAEEFLKLLRSGGAIVSSEDLSEEDIETAREEGRRYLDYEYFAYVYVPIEGVDE